MWKDRSRKKIGLSERHTWSEDSEADSFADSCLEGFDNTVINTERNGAYEGIKLKRRVIK